MFGFKYLHNVVSLELQPDKCNGCGKCLEVCPHSVFSKSSEIDRRVQIDNIDACMECGACQVNCPKEALSVQKGVGCAAGVIAGYFNRDALCSCAPNESQTRYKKEVSCC